MADSVCGVAFSIWLRPSGATAERLAEVIAQVADQFQAPNFPPHVTLLGNAPKGGKSMEVCGWRDSNLMGDTTDFVIFIMTFSLLTFESEAPTSGFGYSVMNLLGVSIEEAKEMTEKLAKSIMPLELKVLPEIAFQNTWNQNVLMYVEEMNTKESDSVHGFILCLFLPIQNKIVGTLQRVMLPVFHLLHLCSLACGLDCLARSLRLCSPPTAWRARFC